METIKSKSGFDINVCCASCINMRYTTSGKKCVLTNAKVESRETCDKHQVRPTLANL